MRKKDLLDLLAEFDDDEDIRFFVDVDGEELEVTEAPQRCLPLVVDDRRAVKGGRVAPLGEPTSGAGILLRCKEWPDVLAETVAHTLTCDEEYGNLIEARKMLDTALEVLWRDARVSEHVLKMVEDHPQPVEQLARLLGR